MQPIVINHPCGDLTLTELQNDVNAAKDKGLSGKWAFTPETVQALIDKIEELAILLKTANGQPYQ